MAKQINNERKNIKINNAEQNLINRLAKILEHKYMTDNVANNMMKIIAEWQASAKEREIKKIDEEIARLIELKKSL